MIKLLELHHLKCQIKLKGLIKFYLIKNYSKLAIFENNFLDLNFTEENEWLFS